MCTLAGLCGITLQIPPGNVGRNPQNGQKLTGLADEGYATQFGVSIFVGSIMFHCYMLSTLHSLMHLAERQARLPPSSGAAALP